MENYESLKNENFQGKEKKEEKNFNEKIIKEKNIIKNKVFVKKIIKTEIPFDYQSLVVYKSFLRNNSDYTKDILYFYKNLSDNIFFVLPEYLKYKLQTKSILEIFLFSDISFFFKIFYYFVENKFCSEKILKIINKKITQKKNFVDLPIKEILENYQKEINEINKDELIKKSPFRDFMSFIPLELFCSEKKIFEPIFITILNLSYFLIYVILTLNKSKIKSCTPPKSLRNKIKAFEDYIKKNKENPKQDIKFLYNHTSIINIINSFLNLFSKLKNKTKNLIRKNENLIEIILNFCVYKYFLDMEKIQKIFNEKKEEQNINSRNSQEKILINFEKRFYTKINLIFKNFDKILTFKIIFMLMDLNKSNLSYIKIISKFNTFISLYSYNNIMCLLNVFDLSNLNLETTTKLIKKLFCSIPKCLEKKDYYKKIINCFFDLILIFKNRNNDEHSIGLKEFSLNIFNEIIITFCDDVEFSSFLFFKFFAKFFKIFGYEFKMVDYSSSNLFFIQKIIYIKNVELYITKEMIEYLSFLINNFSLVIKNKFQKYFEILDNSLIFQGLINIIFIFTKKNKKIEEIKIKTNNEEEEICEDYFTKIILDICSLLLENFESNNLVRLFYNFFNSEFLQEIFDVKNLSSSINSINYNFDFVEINKKKFIKIKINTLKDLYSNLLYYSSYDVSVEYLNVIENIFDFPNFSNIEFFLSFLEILSEKNFFEKKTFDFANILNEEKIFLLYSEKSNFNEKKKEENFSEKKLGEIKFLQENPLKNEIFDYNKIDNYSISQEDLYGLVYKINNFYLIVKNKIFQSFCSKAIFSQEFFLENQEQAFKFILMILNNIDDNEDKENQNAYTIENDIIEITINCLGFLIINCNKNSNLGKEGRNDKLINLILNNSEVILKKLKLLENKFETCTDIIEKIKIFSFNKKIFEEKNFENKTQEKDIKILNILENLENELKKIFDNSDSNFEKSFILYQTYNILNKEIYFLKLEKKKYFFDFIILEKLKILFDIYIGFLKNIDDYMWKISQKNILIFFELFFLTDEKNFEIFFNLIKNSIKNIKNIETNKIIDLKKETKKKSLKKKRKKFTK